jgi:hypothetical protein
MEHSVLVTPERECSTWNTEFRSENPSHLEHAFQPTCSTWNIPDFHRQVFKELPQPEDTGHIYLPLPL